MLGYKAAFAEPILALAAIKPCSACMTSGLRSNKVDGKPTGGIGGKGKCIKSPSATITSSSVKMMSTCSANLLCRLNSCLCISKSSLTSSD